MKKVLLVGLVLATTSLTTFADDEYDDRARVISVTPQVQRVNSPRQECHTEYQRESVYVQPERSLGGAIIGGVAGGLLGHTIGRGNGKVAATAVGVGIGAIVGDRVDNDRVNNYGKEHYETRPVQSCVTIDNWQQVPAGYLVQYEYNGRQYTTITDRAPGRYIAVHVGVRPSVNVSDVAYNQKNDDDDWRQSNGHGHERHNRNYW